MHRKTERTVAALLGLVLALGLLEATLRVAGRMAYPRPDLARAHGDPSLFRILCVGDSFTAGLGDASYPLLLEANLRSRGISTVVVNAGIGGGNTAMIREALPGALQAAGPDLVLLLAGTTNQTNWYGFGAWARDRSLSTRLDQALFHVRVWRFARYAAQGLAPQVSSSRGLMEGGRKVAQRATYRVPPVEAPDADWQVAAAALGAPGDNTALVALQSWARAHPGHPMGPYGVGLALEEAMDLEGARAAYQGCLDLDPEASHCVLRLGLLLESSPSTRLDAGPILLDGARRWPSKASFQWAVGLYHNHVGQPDLAVPYLLECARLDPESTPCFDALGTAAHSSQAQEQIRVALADLAARSSLAADYLLVWQSRERGEGDEGVKRWVATDLVAMVRTVRAAGAPVVLQSYPGPDVMNPVLEEVASAEGVPFVYHQRVFDQLLARGVQRADLFAPDGHCNREGYAYMAMNLAQALVAWGMVPDGRR